MENYLNFRRNGAKPVVMSTFFKRRICQQ